MTMVDMIQKYSKYCSAIASLKTKYHKEAQSFQFKVQALEDLITSIAYPSSSYKMRNRKLPEEIESILKDIDLKSLQSQVINELREEYDKDMGDLWGENNKYELEEDDDE